MMTLAVEHGTRVVAQQRVDRHLLELVVIGLVDLLELTCCVFWVCPGLFGDNDYDDDACLLAIRPGRPSDRHCSSANSVCQ